MNIVIKIYCNWCAWQIRNTQLRKLWMSFNICYV